MRRIAIITISILAGVPAFAQAPPAAPAAAAAPAAPAGPKIPKAKTNEENAAVVTMTQAPDSDARLKAAQDLLTKYPDTEFKAIALSVEAQSFHDKKDDPKAIVAGEQAVDLDPSNFDTQLLMAEIYAQSTRSTDLDMDDRLAKADKYAKDALALLGTAQKPSAQMTDTDWANAKKGEEARAWQAMGLSAILRKKYSDANTDIAKGLELYPDPIDMLRAGRAFLDVKRFDDAISWFDKAAASPNADDQIKKIAAGDKTRAQNGKKQQQ